MKLKISDDLLSKLFVHAVNTFIHKKYISAALIQRKIHVSYRVANEILDKMVAEGYASPRIGLYPCTVLKGRFKRLQSIKAQLLTYLEVLTINFIHYAKSLRIQVTVKYLNRL